MAEGRLLRLVQERSSSLGWVLVLSSWQIQTLDLGEEEGARRRRGRGGGGEGGEGEEEGRNNHGGNTFHMHFPLTYDSLWR